MLRTWLRWSVARGKYVRSAIKAAPGLGQGQGLGLGPLGHGFAMAGNITH